MKKKEIKQKLRETEDELVETEYVLDDTVFSINAAIELLKEVVTLSIGVTANEQSLFDYYIKSVNKIMAAADILRNILPSEVEETKMDSTFKESEDGKVSYHQTIKGHFYPEEKH